MPQTVSVVRAMRIQNDAVLRSLASGDIGAALAAARALSRLFNDPALARLDGAQTTALELGAGAHEELV